MKCSPNGIYFEMWGTKRIRRDKQRHFASVQILRSRVTTIPHLLMGEPIEIDADPPTGIDALLQAALGNETQIPKVILGLVPSVSISISSLLKKTLPTLLRSSAVNLQPVESCITNFEARWTVEELLEAPIPSRAWLNDLEIALKRKWIIRSGITSVQHPTISNLYLPLWAGSFWYSLVGAVEQKEEWRRAEYWVSGQVQDAKVYEARELMGRVPWGMRIWALAGADSSSPVGVLARLLSTQWLSERHLDTLASYLNFRASKDKGGAGKYWVGDVYLSTYVKRVYRAAKRNISNNWDLNRYRDTITTNGYKHLLFPANLNNNHWIIFGVDLIKHEFCYGAPPISLKTDKHLLTTTIFHSR